jgi:hypothetical protein
MTYAREGEGVTWTKIRNPSRGGSDSANEMRGGHVVR